ncbi:6207_t:CDS:10 [Paraglomus occultum]|uniref:6207_t:CDS:1 n=1 Tax=Paraglomus occultum TaxID=144539 RepID=A0A9N8VS00_9GLOM|nr:6207_t:CDS:10 [Paraglomus occultum]
MVAKPPARSQASGSRASTPQLSPSSTEVIDKPYRPELKFTSFAAQPSVVTKYVTSKFLRHDTSYFQRVQGKSIGGKDSEDTKESEDDGGEITESDVLPRSEGEDNEPEVEGSKTLVIHPGSKNLKIGRASDAIPYAVVPHVIARKMRNVKVTDGSSESEKSSNEIGGDQNADNAHRNRDETNTRGEEHKAHRDDDERKSSPDGGRSDSSRESDVTEDAMDEEEEQSEQIVEELKKELKERMKAAKRRPVANATSQVTSFNRSIQSEIILDHNDPYKVEWTAVDEDVDFYIGEKALRLPTTATSYKVRYPIQYGEFNTRDYDSIKSVVGDLETIWTEVIQQNLHIARKEFRNYSVILVIPDIYNRVVVTEMMNMLLRYMGFRRAFVQQESVCVTFGAGMSLACVVDIGAQRTSVSCVEDGMIIPDSRIALNYAGDDITRFFVQLLKKSKFPYRDIDLNRSFDWLLAEDMKQKFCSLNEASPNEPTRKYQLKTYDEIIVAPMILFYPSVINFKQKMSEFTPKFANNIFDDITDGSGTNSLVIPAHLFTKQKPSPIQNSSQLKSAHHSPSPQTRDSPLPSTPVRIEPASTDPASPSVSSAAKTNNNNAVTVDPTTVLPLDDAIAQSIQATMTDDRMKRFYTSIIIVGGGALLPGINQMLEERLVPRAASITEKLEILSPPRELNPSLMAWKGASVTAKLDLTKELWIYQKEWAELGVRCLREKALFVW